MTEQVFLDRALVEPGDRGQRKLVKGAGGATSESRAQSPLTRDLVVHAAVTLVDQGGIESLSIRYNPERDAIDVGGLRMRPTKKLRDVQRTGRASIVIDDVLPHWQPRMIEIRGTAAVVPEGGKDLNERFEDTVVRIQPIRIISFGIDSADVTANARSAHAT